MPSDLSVSTKRLVSIREASEILGVSIDTLRRWDKEGKITSLRPDKKNRYFRLEELEELKLNKKLSISEVSKLLGISQTTLRRIEEKGLITPERLPSGERAYDKKGLENFLHSEYFVNQKEVEDKILETLSDSDNHKENLTNTRVKIISVAINEEKTKVDSLLRFRKKILYGILSLFLFFLIVVGLITFFFLRFPQQTAQYFGYRDSSNQPLFASASGNSNRQVLGAFTTNSGNTDILKESLIPFSSVSLKVVKIISPETYQKVAPKTINDVFIFNETSGVVPRVPILFPQSGYLKIPDTKLINNLNADYIRGKVPTDGEGNLAVINKGYIQGLTINQGNIVDLNITNLDISLNAAIADTKLADIVTPDKVQGSAVQLSANGGIVNNSGLSLLTSCSGNQVLVWNGNAWVCSDQTGKGASDLWTKGNGNLYPNDLTVNLGIGTSNPIAKLTVAGNILPSIDNSYDLGSANNRFQELNLGSSLKLYNSYTDTSNYSLGQLNFSDYQASSNGATLALNFTSSDESNFQQEELKGSASSFTASGSNITLDGEMSAKVAAGCRVNLNGTFYEISAVSDTSNFTVFENPPSSGSVVNIYCTIFNTSLKLNSISTYSSGGSDLSTWTRHDVAIGPNDQWIKSIIYDSTNGKYIVGGYVTGNGEDAVVWESTDLISWTQHTVDAETGDQHIRAMMYDSSHSRYIAVGSDSSTGDDMAVAWESTDLINWTKRIIGTIYVNGGGSYQGPRSIIYVSSSGKYVVGGDHYNGTDVDAVAWESTDLINWTKREIDTDPGYQTSTSLIYDADHGKYVASGDHQSNNGQYYDSVVWESTDLINWTERIVELGNGSSWQRLVSLIYDSAHGKYVGMGTDVNRDIVVWESTNLTSWTKHVVETVNNWPASLIYDPTYGKYIIGGEYDNGNGWPNNQKAAVWESTNLTSWTRRTVSGGNDEQRILSLIYDSANDRYIAAGYDRNTNDGYDAVVWENRGTFVAYPSNKYYIVSTTNTNQINTSSWTKINSAAISASLNSQTINYALSFDGRTTWKIFGSGQADWRSIAKLDSGTWKYNSDSNYSSETWDAASVNTQERALSDAFAVSVNQMTGTDVNAMSDTNWESTGGWSEGTASIDFTTGLETSDTSVSPELSQLSFNYDYNFIAQALTLATSATGAGQLKAINFSVGSNKNMLFLDSTGNVGIGTTVPNFKLDVSGDINFTGNLYQNGTLFSGGSSQWATNGNNIYNVNSGNVGIGTTNPQNLLDVAGGVALGNYAGTNTAPSNGLIVSGNVGIGTSNPQYKLDVNGNFNAGFAAGDWYTGSGEFYTIGGGGYYPGGTAVMKGGDTSNLTYPGGLGAKITTYGGDYAGYGLGGAAGDIVLTMGKDGIYGNVSHLYIDNSDAGHLVTVLENSGNVGIGTTVPNFKLDVSGDINFTGNLYQNGTLFSGGSSQWATNGNNIYNVNSGNVGIGTTNPSSLLQVNGTITGPNNISIQSFQTTGTWIDIPTSASSGIGSGGAGANAWIAYVATNGNWFSNAEVGDIAYRNTSGKLLFGNSSGNATMAITGGNVGIGVTNPKSALDINGNEIRLEGGSSGSSTMSMFYGSLLLGQNMYARNVGGSGIIYDTSNPLSYLQLYSGNIYFATAPSGTAGNLAYPTTVMTILNGGNVGIGTTVPNFKLDVADTQIATSTAMLTNLSTSSTADVLSLKVATTSSQLSNYFVSFLDGNGDILGKIQGNGSGGVSYATNGVDFAEYYKKANPSDNLVPGTLACLSTSGGVTSCDASSSAKLLGVVSDRAGFIGQGQYQNNPSYVLIGIIGQLPVNVSTQSAIVSSDPLTVTSDGKATVATSAGYIIGHALEGYDPSETTTNQVLVSINVSWYDPNSLANNTQNSSALGSLSDLSNRVDILTANLNALQNMFVLNSTASSFLNSATNATISGQLLPVDSLNTTNATISGSLFVLGRTTLNDLGVTGTINSGLLVVNGLDSTVGNQSGASINTLSGDLYLQNQDLGGVNILAGKVTIDANGNMNVEGVLGANTVKTSKLIMQGSVGNAILPAGNTQIEIDTPDVTSTSKVFVTLRTLINVPLVIPSIGNGKFVVEVSNAQTSDINFDWWVVGTR